MDSVNFVGIIEWMTELYSIGGFVSNLLHKLKTQLFVAHIH